MVSPGEPNSAAQDRSREISLRRAHSSWPNSSSAEIVYVSTVQDQGYFNTASGTTSTSYYYGGLVAVPYAFAAGQSSIQVPIKIFDHGLISGSETFGFEVQNAAGVDLASTTFTIVNNDVSTATYSISPGPAAVNENAGTLTFTVARTDSSQQETVYVSTVQDQGYYNAAFGMTSTNYYYDGLNNIPFTFTAGQNSIQLPIAIHDTGLTFGSEKFSLDVQNASGANLASTTFTILNSDHAPTTVLPPPTDIAPTVQGTSSLSEVTGTWLVNFGTVISADDADGTVTSFQLSNLSGSGFFTQGGIRTGDTVTVPSSLLSNIGFNVGQSAGTDQIQIQAVDDQGATSAPFNITVSVTDQIAPAGEPDAATLADLSVDVYRNTLLGASGFEAVPYNVQGDVVDAIDGFKGVVYANSDHSQVEIVFRGTNPADLENLIADGSWAHLPLSQLQLYFDFSVYLLEETKILYPNANIQLAGHSLGGAIAELLGEAAHLPVVAFDAPGAGDFYQTLIDALNSQDPTTAQQLADERNQYPAQNDENYRLFGDVFSKIGDAIGTLVTLPWPGNPLDLNILDRHRADFLASQVHGLIDGTVAAIPNWVDNLIIPSEIVATTAGTISTTVNAFEQYLFDPPGNSDFTFSESEASPSLSSIELPILSGVQAYEIRYETGSSWSAFQRVWPAQWQATGAGVHGIEFVPLNSAGHSVSITEPVMFSLIFSDGGTLNATLKSSALDAVFDPTVQAAGVTEVAGLTAAQLAAAGNVNSALNLVDFSDANQSDTHTVSVTPGSIVSAPSYYSGDVLGTLDFSYFHDTVNGANGQVMWQFSVPDSQIAFLNAGDQIVETLMVNINDSSGGGSSQSVTVTITGAENPPTSVDDNYTVAHDHPLDVSAAMGVLANDSEPDANGLTVSLAPNGGPQHGSLSLQSDGSFTYTPDAGYYGSDGFIYVATDQTLQSTATVTIDVTERAPVASDDDYGATLGQTVHVTAAGVLGNDTDADGDVLSASLVSGPSHAIDFAFNSDGSFSYTPDVAYRGGVDTFTYKTNDGQLDSAPATVTIDLALPADTFDQSDSSANLTVQLKGHLQFAVGRHFGFDRLSGIHNVITGSGRDLIIGSNKGGILNGGAGNDIIHGGTGNDTIIGGLGNDLLSGGGGDNTFVFRSGFGHDTITDFTVGNTTHHDTIDLRGLGFADIADVLDHVDHFGHNAVIHAGADEITLYHVTEAMLSNHPFDILV